MGDEEQFGFYDLSEESKNIVYEAYGGREIASDHVAQLERQGLGYFKALRLVTEQLEIKARELGVLLPLKETTKTGKDEITTGIKMIKSGLLNIAREAFRRREE